MTTALPPLAGSSGGMQPSAEGARGQPLAAGARSAGPGQGGSQPISGLVLSVTRNGALVEVAGQRFLVSGAPLLPPGASLSLDLVAAVGRQARSGRLLAVAGQALAPPVSVQLSPAAPPALAPAPPGHAPQALGVQVEARVLGPAGRPAGAPIPIWLAVAGDRAETAPGPAAATRSPGPTVGGGVLAAEVEGRDPSGRLLLRAAGLTLRLEHALDLPAGARLQLILPNGFSQRSDGGARAAGDDPLRRLIEALLLQPAGTKAAGGTGALRLPAANHALAARLLLWIETLRAGDPAPEPAGAGHADEAGSGALRSALSELGRLAREPQVGGWRVLVLPIGVEDPSPLRLYLRDLPPDPERAARREPRPCGRRAIFELELSQLGRCQLDVLCQAARFDLAVRTDRPLTTALQADIRALFLAALDLAHWAGQVEFRAAELLTLPDPLAPAGRRCTA